MYLYPGTTDESGEPCETLPVLHKGSGMSGGHSSAKSDKDYEESVYTNNWNRMFVATRVELKEKHQQESHQESSVWGQTAIKRASSINLEGLVRRVPPIIPTRSCTETVCHSFVTVAVSAFIKPQEWSNYTNRSFKTGGSTVITCHLRATTCYYILHFHT